MSLLPDEGPVLGGAWDAAGKLLVDINVLDPFVVFVMFDVECYGSIGYDATFGPADALQAQDFVGVITKSLVLI